MVQEKVKRVGEKIARIRNSMHLTLQQLANISGVSPSTIQKIEAGTMVPSIAVLLKIARGLHKKVGFFLDEEEGKTEVSFVRKRDRLSSGVVEDGAYAQRLTAELVDPEIDSLALNLAPGVNSGDEPLRHQGEELAYCVSGTMTFTVDGKEYILEPGDSLHFKSELPHYWRNSGRSRAEVILVCTLPALSDKSLVTEGGMTKRKNADS